MLKCYSFYHWVSVETLKAKKNTINFMYPTKRWRNLPAALTQGDLPPEEHRRIQLLLSPLGRVAWEVSEDLLGGLDIYPLEFGELRTGGWFFQEKSLEVWDWLRMLRVSCASFKGGAKVFLIYGSDIDPIERRSLALY